jgi:dynein heavy chain
MRNQITEFGDVADLTAIVHSLKDVKSVLKRLHDMQGQVAFINKEEALFEWDATTYPTIETLAQECQPFLELFQAIVDWQKSLRKYATKP